VVAVSAYNVIAWHWDHGWELHISGVGVTQSRTLDGAEAMVRDYLRLDDHPGWDTADVVIAVDLGGLEAQAADSRRATEAAAASQFEAGAEARRVAKELRAKGLSVSDMATVLGVSRGRVSQLVK
jgi:hypothetical protein